MLREDHKKHLPISVFHVNIRTVIGDWLMSEVVWKCQTGPWLAKGFHAPTFSEWKLAAVIGLERQCVNAFVDHSHID